MVKLKIESYEMYKEIVGVINKYEDLHPETVAMILKEILKDVYKEYPPVGNKE